jgi:ribulose 1,5-bisphosphate synthetase/thiazole synthase
MSLRSLWHDDTSLPSFSSLEDDTEADVVVVGAGISGMTAALLL